MAAGVDVAGSQVGRHEFVAGEDVQRQKAVMVVVTVKEPLLLFAVNSVVRGVEVEDQVFGRLLMGSDELIDQHLGDLHQCLAIHAVLEATEGWR